MKRKAINIYDNPFYYEVAFAFRDISKEVDFFERCVAKFSEIKVKSVLEIACGPSPHLLELAKRGYTFAGLDLNKEMLTYSMEKARKAGINIKVIQADMRNFKTDQKFDFVFCMLGSISIESNNDFLSHLNSVARCLRKDGLYLIDGTVHFDWTKLWSESWTVIKDKMTINVNWRCVPANYAQQLIMEKGAIEVIENGTSRVFILEKLGKVLFPQEFLDLVAKNGEFEFVGWFNNFDLDQPLDKATAFSRPITLLKRK